MNRNWLSLALWAIFLLLFGHSNCYALTNTTRILHERSDTPPGGFRPTFVFRGDTRDPKEIQGAGGFFPRDPTAALGREPTEAEIKQGNSLWWHQFGTTSQYTQYVSTTTNRGAAVMFAQRAQKENMKRGKKVPAYLYKISADSKMIDLEASLGTEHMIKQYVGKNEQAVVAGIPFEQIEGWYEVTGIPLHSLRGSGNGELQSRFVKNKDFAQKYKRLQGSGAQPQLSGFPEAKDAETAEFKAELHPWKELGPTKPWEAWEKQPWNKYKDQSVQRYLDEFRQKFAAGIEAPKGAGATKEELPMVECRKRGIDCGMPGLDGEEKVPTWDELSLDSLNPLEKTPSTDIAPWTEEQLQQSEKSAEEEFGPWMEKFGLGHLTKRPNNPLSLAKLGSKIKGYGPLAPHKIEASLGKGLGAASLGLWVKDMVDVFSTDSAAWDRAAVVTSIFPFVGCGVGAIADAEHGSSNPIDSAACVLADGLTYSPLAPVGLALHGFRFLGSFVREKEEARKEYAQLTQPEVLNQRRVKGWEERRAKVLERFESKNFTDSLKSWYETEQVTTLMTAARLAGSLRAGVQQAATTEEQQGQLKDGINTAHEELRLQVCAEISQRKRQLADDIEWEAYTILQDQQAEHDREFFEQTGSFLLNNNFGGNPSPGFFLPDGQPVNSIDTTDGRIQTKDEIAAYLESVRSKPPTGYAVEQGSVKNMRKYVEQLETPAICGSYCHHEDMDCEWLACSSPAAKIGDKKDTGRTLVAQAQTADDKGLSEECKARFGKICPLPAMRRSPRGATLEAAIPKQLWCYPSKRQSEGEVKPGELPKAPANQNNEEIPAGTPGKCTKVDKLEVYIEIAGATDAGTNDEIWITSSRKQQENGGVMVLKAPYRNEFSKTNLDLTEIYGKQTVPIGDINYFRAYSLGTTGAKDWWKLRGVRFIAHCADKGVAKKYGEVGKYRDVYLWYDRWTMDSLEFPLTVDDWVWK